MVFQGVCLITEDVARLCAFYQAVLGCEKTGDDVHAELVLSDTSIAVYSREASERDMLFTYPPNAGCGYAVLSFRVEDVDGEYARLRSLNVDFITEPRTYPWGARSVHFRDPDGNIVTFVQTKAI